MVVCEVGVADFERRLGAGESDAPLVVHADAPKLRLPLLLPAKLFAAQGRHRLQAGDGYSRIHQAQLAKGAFLQRQRHAFDGLARKQGSRVLGGKMNDHDQIIPNIGNKARTEAL